jgi:serine/threonine protein kinase
LSGTRPKNWKAISESQFPWEREALDFVRERFPDHEPYRAWSNFEFIADDGSVNEVDLLVFSPQGFFLIEIKSHPGRLSGDAGTWTFEHEGKLSTIDSPLLDANRKAKKLAGLLQKQRAVKQRLPFIEALVFCSAPDLKCDLQGNARSRVCLRDVDAKDGQPARDGIMAVIKRRACPGLDSTPKGEHNRPTAKVVSQALEQAGIKPQQRHRKVSDYILEELVDEGPGYQDWQAVHAHVKSTKRLVRLYTVRTEAKAEDREAIERAAKREFQLLEALQHPGIIRAHGFTEHELGPALILEYDPAARRLDHYLRERKDSLSADQRVYLIRQLADVIRFAHERRVVHRALSPRSILVTDADAEHPKLRVYNWQVGYRDASATSTGLAVSVTSHIDRLVDDETTAFMAPEALTGGDDLGEHVDVFSLGALAYYIFSGVPPAENGLALSEKLRGTSGLQIAAVLNGAGSELQDLIEFSTHPDVANRLDSVADFMEQLDLVEREVHAPQHEILDNPNDAQPGDGLPEGYKVIKWLGRGSTSVALLVEREDDHLVLKAATNPEHNQRLIDESEVLQQLRHQHIVDYVDPLQVGDHAGFLVRPVFQDKEKLRIETLGDRVRKEGRLHVDLLERFGEDLIDVVRFLEEQGIPHRDIKPDNIAAGMVGRGNKLHLVLFDFSLSRAPQDNIRAGTKGYLDPMLPLRKRWDLHAERYAVAVTLYELATGTLPQWGDGKTDPSHLTCEITVDSELFDASLRERLTRFFQRALKRKAEERFDNAEDMLREWRQCFEDIEEPGALTDPDDEEALRERLSFATPETPIHELGLGTRATNALDRNDVVTVANLIVFNLRDLQRLRGVGNKTRREISYATRILRKRLLTGPSEEPTASITSTGEIEEPFDVATLSVDLLANRVTRPGSREEDSTKRALRCLLGLDDALTDPWPNQIEVARLLNVSRARIGQLVTKFQERWSREPSITRLRDDIAEAIEKAGGVMTGGELAEAVLAARGSAMDDPLRTQYANAVVRAAVEVERSKAEPRFMFRRVDDRVLIALQPELADYAVRLGKSADTLAADDPLATPARVVERLRAIAAPENAPALSDVRLVRLAAAASQTAAVSSRQELYPRGMDAARALKLSQGALLGVQKLSIRQIRDRVLSRYPEADPLPDRPRLDSLLQDIGFVLEWDPAQLQGEGCYINRTYQTSSLTVSTDTTRRYPTMTAFADVPVITPEVADARAFEERLQRAEREGAFLALLVNPKHYQRAMDELEKRFPIQRMDLEGLVLDALKDEAQKAGANWDLVLQADATRGQGDWDKLLLLVRRAIPRVEKALLSAEKTVLLIYPGLIARYGQMDLLERLRDKVGRRDGIPGLWLLMPGDGQALIEEQALPILGPGQCTRIPKSWLENLHRSQAAGAKA